MLLIQERKTEVLAALRSSEYRQHRGAISDATRNPYTVDCFLSQGTSFCCIGLAGKVCDVPDTGNWHTSPVAGALGLHKLHQTAAAQQYLIDKGLAKLVRDNFTLEDTSIALNDGEGWTFAQIADFWEVAV